MNQPTHVSIFLFTEPLMGLEAKHLKNLKYIYIFVVQDRLEQGFQDNFSISYYEALDAFVCSAAQMIWIDKFCRLLLLRIIYEQAVTQSVKAEHQDAFQILLPFDIGKSVFPKGV